MYTDIQMAYNATRHQALNTNLTLQPKNIW